MQTVSREDPTRAPWRRPRRWRLPAWSAAIALMVAGCGGTGTPLVDDGEPSRSDALAPECHEVEELVATAPDGQPPTGLTADPGDLPVSDDQDARPSAEAERESPEREDEPDTAPGEPHDLAQRIQQWGERDAADSFAGLWVDHDLGGYAVAFTDDVDRHAEEVRERFHPGIAVAEAEDTYAEMRDVQERITREEMSGTDVVDGDVQSVGAQVMINRTVVAIVDPDEQRLAELSETYGATTICFEIEWPPEPIGEGMEPLAKASGWRDQLDPQLEASAVLEVAYERSSAERAWRENVPDDLEPRDDDLPAEPGRYGDLGDVDFDRQAVVVWSAGESGSCPGWLADIDARDGVVHLEQDATGQMCTDDFHYYRMVLAVDRDRLPPADDLAQVRVEGVSNAEVRGYPDGG